MLFAEAYVNYHEEYNMLVDTMHRAISSRSPVLYLEAPWVENFYYTISDIRNESESDYIITEEEIRAQLSYMWIDFVSQYNERTPNVHIKRYLISRSVWGLRDWYRYQMNICTQDYSPGLTLPATQEEEVDVGFRLDVGFLLFGTYFFPLSELTPYERYIIFLKYREEKTILEIARIVQKSSSHVKRVLHSTTNKLKELARDYAEKNTNRPCSRGPRLRRRRDDPKG